MVEYNKNFASGAKSNKVPTTDILNRVREAGKKKEIIQRIRISPAEAEDLLTINEGNRHVTVNDAVAYAETMTAGLWEYNVNSNIGISTEGKLIDAQHRLWGQVFSQTSQEWNIITGLPPKSFATTDMGRNRTKGDIFSILNKNEPNKAASICNFAMSMMLNNKLPTQTKRTSISNQMILRWTEDPANMKRLDAAMEITINVLHKEGKGLLPFQYWGGLFFLFGSRSITAATEFLTKLATGDGIGIKKDSTIFQCRKNLEKHAKNKDKGTNFARIAWVIQAWNMYRNGMDLGTERLALNPKETEFPKIK